jgi:AAA ATPase domain/AAA domain, putative AbiEii toxin, Type IV TA system
MLKSLKIKNFRCLEEFDLPQLGRVNLLVGKNNSGKTSILEALHILNSPDTVQPFFDIIESRGEYSLSTNDDNSSVFEVIHFLHGHQIDSNSSLELLGVTDKDKKINFSLSLTSTSIKELELGAAINNKSFQDACISLSHSPGPNYVMEWKTIDGTTKMLCFPLNVSSARMIVKILPGLKSSRFISVSSTDPYTIIENFNEIVLTPQEEILYESLRSIEPGIERIATVATQGYHRVTGNGGFVVSINRQRVPIGSMGYGIWRMLEITLAMVNIPGGTLLIDEIDTGLHFSVMIDLWKLICKTAEKLDIQVFATTHNSDCWKSLAEVANSDDIASDDITIHRIERGKKASVVFNEEEMAIAAARDIEVR